MPLLAALERLGIVALPAKKSAGRGRQRPIQPGDRSAPQPLVEGPLASLEPLRLRFVSSREEAAARTVSSIRTDEPSPPVFA